MCRDARSSVRCRQRLLNYISCRSTTDAQIVRPYSSRFGESVGFNGNGRTIRAFLHRGTREIGGV